MNRLLELAKADLVNARDNLYRAQMAARQCDPKAQYGQSGQTLQEIIDGYAEWERAALAAVAQAEALQK